MAFHVFEWNTTPKKRPTNAEYFGRIGCSGGEVPTAKLAALQKVLQSDFLRAVREVYEHVYETVEIAGSADVRASATAKATIAAFAAR